MKARFAPPTLLAITLLLRSTSGAFGQTITELPLPAGTRPWDITAGPDGSLWFTDIRDAIGIGRITTAGEVTEFPVAAPGLVFPSSAITTGPDGNLWIAVTDFDGFGLIGRITPAGTFSEFLLPRSWGADDIIAGPDGNLWFTAEGSSIGRITTSGAVTQFSIPTAQSGQSGIAAGPDGNLWFTEFFGNRIGRITIAGVITEFPIPTASSEPTGITASPDGNLWFTESRGNKIGRITPSGVIAEFSIPTDASRPTGITWGPDGNIWFTESAGNKIGRITTTGVITEFPIPTASSGPVGITTGPDGNIWFTEFAGKIGRLIVSPLRALETRVLPVVGSTPGAGGTFFKTAVQLHNSTNSVISGRIVFHASGVTGSGADPARAYALSSGETQSIADLLPAMGRTGLGSADIEVTSGSAPVATVRVFNDAGSSGTTGFTEVPMRTEEALRAGQQGVLLLPSDLTGFRFNIGVRTLEEGTATTLILREASGAVLETISRNYPPTYHEQQSAGAFLGVASLPPGGSIEINPTAGAAIFYGATVDNRTGDPSLQIAKGPFDY